MNNKLHEDSPTIKFQQHGETPNLNTNLTLWSNAQAEVKSKN